MTAPREDGAGPGGLAAVPPAERLLATFTYARMDEMLNIVQEALPTGEEQAAELRAYARKKVGTVRALAVALGSPEDVDELYHSLASLWLELRFEWERHNTVANFGLAVTGESDPAVMTAGATISGMLGWLDELLSPSDIDRLVEKALGLLDGLRPSVADGSLRPVG